MIAAQIPWSRYKKPRTAADELRKSLDRWDLLNSQRMHLTLPSREGKIEVMDVRSSQATPLRGLFRTARVAVSVCMGHGQVGDVRLSGQSVQPEPVQNVGKTQSTPSAILSPLSISNLRAEGDCLCLVGPVERCFIIAGRLSKAATVVGEFHNDSNGEFVTAGRDAVRPCSLARCPEQQTSWEEAYPEVAMSCKGKANAVFAKERDGWRRDEYHSKPRDAFYAFCRVLPSISGCYAQSC
jgi:hypothetical protein